MSNVILHELYFAGLTLKPALPAADLRAALGKRFGSLNHWDLPSIRVG